MRAISGISFLLIIAILTFLSVLLIIANCDTSAEVPAVDGIQQSGGPGFFTTSTPS